MGIYTSIQGDIYVFPASPLLAEHPARPHNPVGALRSLTWAKPLGKAGCEGRKSFITRQVISHQGHVLGYLHKPQLLRC